jgi:GTP diphosphokinase / guanosine-3',5'-bis(diphosphate) 3'-diphosphatase
VEIQNIINEYKSYGILINEPLVEKAIEFAIKYHGSQKRSSGEPYYRHPLEVARIIAQMKLDSDSIITAILHDTVEDTELTIQEIKTHFGDDIAKLIDGVTKLSKIEFKEKNLQQAENFRKLFLAISNDIRVLLVKLADRLHNMRTIDHIPDPEKRKRIALETMEIYAPLSERIGIQKIKVELQDLSFKILCPEIRESIITRSKSIIHTDKENYVEQIVAAVKNTLEKGDIKCKVFGRRKTPYSIWMKMKQKDIGVDQLCDIIAFRVIVEKVEDCYTALGIIHSAYQMIPDSFQDFISTPKENGYKSLHTVVLGPLVEKIEIQIRTQEMHNVAELGVAAHWRYKQGYKEHPDSTKYAWIRKLLSILEHNASPEEFLQNTRLAMDYNQVFCFSPKGNLVSLPKGATVIDFAYMIHSKVGSRCTGAKVNGRFVNLSTELINGDQVEVITSKDQTVSPDWENFAVTGKAKSEIRKTLRIQQYDQYVQLGKDIINKSFKISNIQDQDEALDKACKFFNKSTNDLLFAIGKGTISREDVVKKAQPKQNPLSATLSFLRLKGKKGKPITQEVSVPIKGLVSGMAIHYAKCCSPLPGNKIVGIIHAGSGVTIHTSDCEMLNNFSGIPESIIDLTWDANPLNIPLLFRINVIFLNKVSSLAIVSGEIAKHNGNIINIKMIDRNVDFFEVIFDIEVESLNHANDIIDALRTKEIVQQIKRIEN